MALINVTNIIVENNPAPFLSNLQLSITFECVRQIEEEIEWKLIYIGSAKDEKYDQVLDCFSMGPLEPGVMQFTLESNPPDYQKIPTKEDLLGVTAIIISVAYKEKEFFRCGYYVYNQYTDPELIENDPPEVDINKVQRSILADKPRITRFDIDWGYGKEVTEHNGQQEFKIEAKEGMTEEQDGYLAKAKDILGERMISGSGFANPFTTSGTNSILDSL